MAALTPLQQSSVSLLRDYSVVVGRRNTPPTLDDEAELNVLSGVLPAFSQTDVADIVTFLRR